MPRSDLLCGLRTVSLSIVPAEQVVERIAATAVNQNAKRGDGPHQRIFQAEPVPEIAADAPAFDIGDQKKNENHCCDRPREQAECE